MNIGTSQQKGLGGDRPTLVFTFKLKFLQKFMGTKIDLGGPLKFIEFIHRFFFVFFWLKLKF